MPDPVCVSCHRPVNGTHAKHCAIGAGWVLPADCEKEKR